MSRFDDIDLVDVPDQWDEIVQRARDAGLLELTRVGPPRRVRWVVPAITIAAAVALVAIVVGVRVDDRADVATDPGPRGDGVPDLVCPDGQLVDGSLPDDAVAWEEPLHTASMVSAVSWSWEVDGRQVQVNVPPIPWVDEGHPSEPVDDPEGTLLYQPLNTNFSGPTGLAVDGGCGSYEVMVAGGTSDEEAALAREVARSLRWEPYDALRAADLDDTDSVLRWAVRDAAGRAVGNGTATVYVYEWQVGDDVPARWAWGETNSGARRWTTVVVGGPGLTFTSLRGPAGSPPSSGQVLTTFFGVGGERGLYISDDASLPAHLQPARGPSPMLVVGSPAAD